MNCGGCGSRLSEGATVCDLCGTPVGPDGGVPREFEEEDLSGEETPLVPEASHAEGDGEAGAESAEVDGDSVVFCNACGSDNPAGSNFCSQCGSKLRAFGGKKAGPRPQKEAPKKQQRPPKAEAGKAQGKPASSGGVEPGAGKRMAILFGAAVLIVLAVYMVISNGGSSEPAQTTSVEPGVPVEPPLSAEFASRESELRRELASLSGDERIDKQRELLTLYFTSGRMDLAGAQAEQIGTATGDESAWIDAGNFYYDWMERSDPQFKAYYSRKATDAYQKALEINPDNLDVRTDMAVAYLYDPEQTMLAIQETARVLEADSNHVQANFNRGIMLWQINRTEEAIAQFEKVLRLVDDPDNPLYQRANEALQSLR